MLKKILLTSIALSLFLNANSNLNEEFTCTEGLESCLAKCEKIESYEDNLNCIDKCEFIFEKCELFEEPSDENKDLDESEKESN